MSRLSRFHARTPRWSWAFLVIAALVLPGGTMVLGQNAEPSSTKDARAAKNVIAAAERTPTLAEIAKANAAAWNAIKSVDLECTATANRMIDGKTVFAETTKFRWSRSGKMERSRKYPSVATINLLPDGAAADTSSRDFFCDGKTARYFMGWSSNNQDKERLTFQNQKNLCGQMEPKPLHSFAARDDLEPLRYLEFSYGKHSPTLADIVAAWKVSVTGKRVSKTGDTLWLLHAEYPPKDGKDQRAGSFIDIEVNADKGFMTQKATFYEAKIAINYINCSRMNRYSTKEVVEYQDCGHGLFFPKKLETRMLGETLKPDFKKGGYCFTTIEITKLSINEPMPADAFDFRFPENLLVHQVVPGKEGSNFIIWGANDKPAKVFYSVQEYNRYENAQGIEVLRRRVEKNLASKKPEEAAARGFYYMLTRKYDEAIAAFSAAMAADPKSDEIVCMVQYRCMAYLIRENYEKTIADATETMRLTELLRESGDERAMFLARVTLINFFRAIAYAQRDETLDKAAADLAELRAESQGTCGDEEDITRWTALLHATILIRQGKTKTPDEAKRVLQAIECGFGDADAPALAVVFLKKSALANGDPAYAAKLREAAKRVKGEPWTLISERIAPDIAPVVHKCLVRLVPEIEKKP